MHDTIPRLRPLRAPSTTRITVASLIGIAIEFYDFHICGTAAALVLGELFVPRDAAGTQSLAAFATLGIAFFARPIGSFIVGHFGDRLGCKSTLVRSRLLTGISTTLIDMLSGYASAGAPAPVLLWILRLGQGTGLGGAALLAIEKAPHHRHAWFGMFPRWSTASRISSSAFAARSATSMRARQSDCPAPPAKFPL